MKAVGLCAALMLTLVVSACSESAGGGGTPATPTPTNPSPNPSPTNPSCVPAAPNNLRLSANGSTRVFNWDAVSNAQDYFIQIGHAGQASGAADLIDTNTSQTTYTWAGASAGNYWARVYARNSCGSGANSTQIFFN